MRSVPYVAKTPALPANQENEAKVSTAIPKVNLRARRLVADRAPLQVAHSKAVQVSQLLCNLGVKVNLQPSEVYGWGEYMPKE